MDIDKFRIKYSELIENYQWIEFQLKVIYSCLKMPIPATENTNLFLCNLTEVNSDGLNLIVNKIKDLEKKKDLATDLTYERIEEMRKRRNYWCHNCFIDIVYDKTGSPRKKYSDELLKDVVESERLREEIEEIKKREFFR